MEATDVPQSLVREILDHHPWVLYQPLDDLVNTTINSSGKYIPPFRRGSHSSAMPISKDKLHEHGSFNKNKFDLVLLKDGGASSVPVRSADWLHFKKDWSDYA